MEQSEGINGEIYEDCVLEARIGPPIDKNLSLSAQASRTER
jgi:hypothetical protein